MAQRAFARGVLSESELPVMQWDAQVVNWCLQQEGWTRDRSAQWVQQASARLETLAVEYLRRLRCPDGDEALCHTVQNRLWACIYHHWRTMPSPKQATLEKVIARVQSLQVGQGGLPSDLARDVVLAQCLEQQLEPSLTVFEREYLPGARDVARRTAGEYGGSVVDNLIADLIMPRDGRPPRIAQYQGRTCLELWLRVVTVNLCRSAMRKTRRPPLDESPAVAIPMADRLDHGPCRDLLAGLIRHSLQQVPTEDRLLVKWLVLDEVPQFHVARCLRIHSGNVTRRRQRIVRQIWDGLQQAARQAGRERMTRECLELVLTGEDRQLRQELGLLLADGLETAAASSEEPAP